jgi:hypothetical protein
LRPSGSVICFSSAAGSPLRSGDTITVTVSPALSMLNFQPARLRMLVLAPSISQWRVWPVAGSGASISKYTCGFAHLYDVTTPVSLICTVVSYGANE